MPGFLLAVLRLDRDSYDENSRVPLDRESLCLALSSDESSQSSKMQDVRMLGTDITS